MRKILFSILCAIMAVILPHCSSNYSSDTGSSTASSTTTTTTTTTSSSTTSKTITNSTASLDATSGCVDGVNTSVDSSLPSWIKDNFKCQVVYVSGSNYVFKTADYPNHASYYWAGSTVPAGTAATYPLYASLPAGNSSAGTNKISGQSLILTIPSSPAVQSSTKTGTQGGLVAIGVTVNGLAIFNNAAAPGDTLATEAATFDAFGGHPQSGGVYHHHANVYKVSNNDANLIGIALDGYAIYGKKCDNATASTGDDTTPSDLDTYHGHTKSTTHFATATYHYHLAADATAGIDTLMGSFFYGIAGSASN